MKCNVCGNKMNYAKEIPFNNFKIDGYKCSCGEIYFDPGQAQKILLLNKLQKETVKARLGKVRSNLILRLPKDIETALNLEKGEIVSIKIEGKGIKITPEQET